jgi:hypothetical protein
VEQPRINLYKSLLLKDLRVGVHMFQIVSGVPLPPAARGRRAVELPLAQMNAGDSFLIPFVPAGDDGKKTLESWRRKVLAAKKKVQKEHPEAGFRTAVVNDEHGQGLRVWCTA